MKKKINKSGNISSVHSIKMEIQKYSMPTSYSEMEWGDPILPKVHDKIWEEEVKKDLGYIPDLMMRVSRIEWLRTACLKWARYEASEFPKRLGDIAVLVCAQENACRYCYGVAKSQLKLFGYSQKMINQIEEGMHLAELDEKERAFIQFCRNLARSSPRPPKKDRDRLIALGFSEKAVAEMAFYIANQCFINRVATFISCLPMHNLEQVAGNLFGKLFRPILARRIRSKAWKDIEPLPNNVTTFPGIIQTLEGLPAASVINNGLTGVFKKGKLSEELKVLMFAVIAKSLDCDFCTFESKTMANNLGINENEFENSLSTLSCGRLNHQESQIFLWTRETVHFETGDIQMKMQKLSSEIEGEKLLEAIGVASLANSIVRLAVLLG